MKRPILAPSAIVLAFALSSCATTDIAPPPDNLAEDAVPSDVEGAVVLARTQRESGNFNGAIATLSQLVLIAPDDPRVLGEYGKTLIDKGESTDALAFLQRAIELDGDEWSFYSAQGVAHAQIREYRAAEVSFNRALMLRPDEPTVLNNYAMAHLQAGNIDRAEALLMRAEMSGGAFPQIGQNLALVRQMKAERRAAPATPVIPAEPVIGDAIAAIALETVPAPIAESFVEAAPPPLATASETIAPTEPPASTAALAPEPVEVAEMSPPSEGPVEVIALARPAPSIRLPASGPIYLQVGSFSSVENAERFSARLAELRSQVTLVAVGERTLHRVSVGPFENREAAETALTELDGLGVRDIQVMRQAPAADTAEIPSAETRPEAPASEPEAPESAPDLRFSENL
jgi:Flp pilus assembly protein TadD